MSEAASPLGLGEHQLVAAITEDGSVTRWLCLDCDRTFDCASQYLSANCVPPDS